VIVLGFSFFLNSYYLRSATLEVVALNGIVVLAAMYFMQGLAVVGSAISTVKSKFMRTLAYIVIVFFFQSLSIVIVMLGVADVWFNFRLKRWRFSHN
jgi:Na+-driven multidrug efflux pump